MVSAINLNQSAKMYYNPYGGYGRPYRRPCTNGNSSLYSDYGRRGRYSGYNSYYYPPIGYGPGMYGGYYPYLMDYRRRPRYGDYYPNLLL